MPATFDPSLVYFVGAGPGDPELITLKGYNLLSQADVIIYAGSLINKDLLHYCKAGAACHDSASLNLGEIIDLMATGVHTGKLVVRLQTGDLSLYGSIREQGEELAKLGIGFCSVPGVSSFSAAAAAIPKQCSWRSPSGVAATACAADLRSATTRWRRWRPHVHWLNSPTR